MNKPVWHGTKGHREALSLNKSMDQSSLPDGRPKSSAFQKSSPNKSIAKIGKSVGDYATSDKGIDTISKMPGMGGIGLIAKIAKGARKKKKEEPKKESTGNLDMSSVADNLKEKASPAQKAGCMEGDPGCGGNFKVKKKSRIGRAIKKAASWVSGEVKDIKSNIKRKKKEKKRRKNTYDSKGGSHKTVRYL